MAEPSEWATLLHAAVKAMAVDDPDLAFTSSLLAYALKHGDLTDRQAKYGNRVLDRVRSGAGSVNAV